MNKKAIRLSAYVLSFLALSFVFWAPLPAQALVSVNDVEKISTANATQICGDMVAPLNSALTSLQSQVYGWNPQSVSQPIAVGGAFDTSALEARIATLEKITQDQSVRIQQLEQRTGYLEMALDYFNGWLGKFKIALKMK